MEDNKDINILNNNDNLVKKDKDKLINPTEQNKKVDIQQLFYHSNCNILSI